MVEHLLDVKGVGGSNPSSRTMDITIIYEDQDLLVVDKPAGMVCFPEVETEEKTLIQLLTKQRSELKQVGEAPRYGIVHRLDKDTSGVLLVAKNEEALIFLQKQFKNKVIEKKYLCLVEGVIKEGGVIDTYLARSSNNHRKQTVYEKTDLLPADAREALTEYTIVERYNEYTLLQVQPRTGRKHQIRVHMAWLHHPVVGDKVYGFKNSKVPEGLTRQFLHACDIMVQMPNGEMKEFHSELPEELETVINNIENVRRK